MRWYQSPLGQAIEREAVARAPRKRSAIDAGAVTRLTSSWIGSNNSIDQDVYASLDRIRRRSRDLAYNNPYVRKFLGMCATHIVGPNGFQLQVRAPFSDGSGLDEVGNSAVEAAFAKWAARGTCEASGRLSFWDVCRLAVRAVARDGECLIRKVYGNVNEYGFGLMLIDIDRLDINKNEVRPNGNLVRMGVEITPQGRPVAYYLRRAHPGDLSGLRTPAALDFERVPASDIYHLGVPDRPEQTRYLPWLIAAMVRLQMLGQYEEAANVAANFGASKMAVITSPDGEAAPLSDGTDGAADPTLYQDIQPGETRVLPAGYSMDAFDPAYPHEQFATFVKAMLRGVAVGVGESGVSYNALASDLEGVNFSSIRQGVLDERDAWMMLQTWFEGWLLRPVFEDCLPILLAGGFVKTPRGAVIGLDKLQKFSAHKWQARRWPWVDPRADMDAAVTAVQQCFKSRRQVIAEMGGDIEDVWKELAEEQARAKALGLNFGEPIKAPADTGPDQTGVA